MLEGFPEHRDYHDRLPETPGLSDFLLTPEGNRHVSGALNKLLGRLKRFFAVEKASLAFYDSSRKALQVTHMYADGVVHDGLTLSLPEASSAQFQVLAQGFPVADNFPDRISSHIIEKKMLMTPSTRSVLIIPLIRDGLRLGVLSLSSTDDYAFGLYMDGVGQGMVDEFVVELKIEAAQADKAAR